MIVSEYRQGRTVKSIEKQCRSYSIDADGKPLPKGYVQQVVYAHVMEEGL